MALDAVEWRVSLHRLAHVARDERVEALHNRALPSRHRGDVRIHRRFEYAFTGASPSAFAICGLPPERTTTPSLAPA